MKFTSYNPVVKGNTINAEVRLPREYSAAVEGESKIWGELGKGVKAIGLAIQAQEDEADKQTILAKMDEYNKGMYSIMYNKEDGLMNTTLDGSAGVSQTFLQKEAELRKGVIEGGKKIRNKKYQAVLMQNMNQAAMSQFQRADRHEYAEGQKVKEVTYNNNMQNLSEIVSKDPYMIDEAVRQAMLFHAAYADGKNWDEGTTKASLRERIAPVLNSALSSALSRRDYPQYNYILQHCGHLMDDKTRNSIIKVANEIQREERNMNAAMDIYQEYKDDPEGAMRKIYSGTFTVDNGGISGEGTTWVRADKSVSFDGIQDLTMAGMDCVARDWYNETGEMLTVTSGTDSTNIHAAGQYSHAGGYKLDIVSPKLDTPDGRALFKKIAAKYGVIVNDEYENPSPNSTGGHMDCSFQNCKLPIQVRADGSRGMSTLATWQEQQDIAAKYDAIQKSEDSIKNARYDKEFHAFWQETYKGFYQGVSYKTAYKTAVQKAGNDRDMLKSLTGAVEEVYSMLGGGSGLNRSGLNTGGLSELGMDSADVMLRKGRFKSEEEYLGFLKRNGASADQLYVASNNYQSYRNGTNSYFNVCKYTQIKEEELQNAMLAEMPKGYRKKVGKKEGGQAVEWATRWAYAKQYAAIKMFEYAQKYKRQPSSSEVIEFIREGLREKRIGRFSSDGTFHSIEYAPSQALAHGIRSISEFTGESGRQIGDMFIIDYLDNSPSEIMNSEALNLLFNDQLIPARQAQYEAKMAERAYEQIRAKKQTQAEYARKRSSKEGERYLEDYLYWNPDLKKEMEREEGRLELENDLVQEGWGVAQENLDDFSVRLKRKSEEERLELIRRGDY